MQRETRLCSADLADPNNTYDFVSSISTSLRPFSRQELRHCCHDEASNTALAENGNLASCNHIAAYIHICTG
ncbi:hypothetical protein FOBRF1_002626 [Fusarium oxysporum]